VSERASFVADWAGLDAAERALLTEGLSVAAADKMVENVVGCYSLPLGIATNLQVNGTDYLVPMVTEEPSVVAAVSNAARLARVGGGFVAGSTEPIMIGQVQLLGIDDPAAAENRILSARDELLAMANTSPTIARLGGGPVDIRVHHLPVTETEPMLIVHLHVDVRDAMGANAVNTALEAIAPALEELSGGRALLRILTNLTNERRAWAEVLIPARAFDGDERDGADVIRDIAHANAFAVCDAHRAATHNKGIMNGVDAVAMATGNDWRAIEAGAHAWAARSGSYRALTEWRVVEQGGGAGPVRAGGTPPGSLSGAGDFAALYGRLEMPLAVGIVGGATRSHPQARVAMKVLGVGGARELAEVMASVGLAQNLAALRALVGEGIQRGHMSLHARQVAVAGGAQGEQVDVIAAAMVSEGEIRVERARSLMAQLQARGLEPSDAGEEE
jgi:hydroxymethylglutaryl-CoA reductase